MKYCFGVDVGGTSVKMGLFQVDGYLCDKWEIPTRTEFEEDVILSDIASSLKGKLEEKSIQKEQVLGIGMGIPAAVMEEGYVKTVVNLGWKDKSVKKEMEALTNMKVHIANDANVAALGEMWKGGGEGYKNLVMVTLGTGVGGGIILEGKIVSGTHGGGGEIGHLCVETEEAECCGCGAKGCLEQYASATGIVRLAKQKLKATTKKTVLCEDGLTAKDIFDAVKAGDELALEVAEAFGAYLGTALANIGAILDPEIFVIGGGVSKAGPILIDYIKKYYVKTAFFTCREVKFAMAKLGNDAGIYGAAKLVIE